MPITEETIQQLRAATVRTGRSLRPTDTIVAWQHGQVPLVSKPREVLRVEGQERALSALLTAVRNIQEYKARAREYEGLVQTAIGTLKELAGPARAERANCPVVSETDIRDWCSQHMPSVLGVKCYKDFLVIDFCANESRLKFRRDDQRLLIPRTRFVMTPNTSNPTAFAMINGIPSFRYNVHPHMISGNSVCPGDYGLMGPPASLWRTDPTTAYTIMLGMLRDWRKTWQYEVGAYGRVAEGYEGARHYNAIRGRAAENYLTDPSAFAPIEALDGTVYPTLQDMIVGSPRGFSARTRVTSAPQLCARCRRAPCACCRDCRAMPCICEHCPACDLNRYDCRCWKCPRCSYAVLATEFYPLVDNVTRDRRTDFLCPGCDHSWCWWCGIIQRCQNWRRCNPLHGRLYCHCTRCVTCRAVKDELYGCPCDGLAFLPLRLAIRKALSFGPRCFGCANPVGVCNCGDTPTGNASRLASRIREVDRCRRERLALPGRQLSILCAISGNAARLRCGGCDAKSRFCACSKGDRCTACGRAVRLQYAMNTGGVFNG